MFSSVMLNLPDWRAIFAPSGRLLREGELIQRANLSRTLTTIALEGPGALYKVVSRLQFPLTLPPFNNVLLYRAPSLIL